MTVFLKCYLCIKKAYILLFFLIFQNYSRTFEHNGRKFLASLVREVVGWWWVVGWWSPVHDWLSASQLLAEQVQPLVCRGTATGNTEEHCRNKRPHFLFGWSIIGPTGCANWFLCFVFLVLQCCWFGGGPTLLWIQAGVPACVTHSSTSQRWSCKFGKTCSEKVGHSAQ